MTVNAGQKRLAYQTPAAQLLGLLRGDHIVVAPGVFDGITGRAAIKTGFECLYMSGAAVTASRLGLPDLAFASMDDFVETASVLANIPGAPPLICDADTGFGSAAQIARLTQRYHRAGVAGFHIEDQLQTKRCGHLLGKQLVDGPEFIQRIKAAVYGRNSIPGGSDIVIIARTDALQSLGMGEAIQRLKDAVAAGADVAFLEGAQNENQIREVVKAVAPAPVLVNLVRGGSTPDWTAADCQALGAKLAIVPGAALASVASAAVAAYTHVKEHGLEVLAKTLSGLNAPRSPKEFFTLVGLEEALMVDAAAGGKSYVEACRGKVWSIFRLYICSLPWLP